MAGKLCREVRSVLVLIFVLCYTGDVFSQGMTIRGKVTDANSGSAIPFVNVYFKNTQTGVTTDFDGYYNIKRIPGGDSLVVSYVGYLPKTKVVPDDPDVTIDFQLEEDVITLQEIVFTAEENPAFKILRNVRKNKAVNDKRSLEAYEYESYTKIEFDVDNITEKFKNRKIIQKISAVMDSIEQIAGEDGNPILPVFMSEAISRFYYRENPVMKHEEILKTKISALGITDGTTTSQFVGSSFQQYNFYENWLTILEKEFVSPIADSWRGLYDYYLTDSLYLGDDFCYRIEFSPKSEQDLAFLGTMWITKNEWAIRQIEVTVDKSTNLNFIEKMRIQQELQKTSAGPWLPLKTRVIIDLNELTKNTAGILAKFYVSNKDIVVNKPRPNSFYELPILMAEDIREDDGNFWNQYRHDSLTSTEENLYVMIDTMKKIPFVKVTSDIAKIFTTGYYTTGKFDIGPYSQFGGMNNIEGYRLGFGVRTNYQFSKKWVLQGTVGYGFTDKRWKYDVLGKYIISRNPWTTLQVRHKFEIDPIWSLNDDVSGLGLFYTYTRFGTLTAPFAHTQTMVRFDTQMGPGWINRIYFKHQIFIPEFNFRYITNPGGAIKEMDSTFTTSEIQLETRYGKDETFVVNDNERLTLGTDRFPLIKIKYILGLKDVWGSDFTYHKIFAQVEKHQKLGVFGVSSLTLYGGYIFNSLPYPLLKAHAGNETPFFTESAYNLMNYYEFSSDHYAAFRWRHHFEGLFFNRIPLMKKLKWRSTTNADVIMGGMRKENLDRIETSTDSLGNALYPFSAFDTRPYIELGYGVENIFKFFRVDFFHRMSYLEHPDIRRFGVKVSLQLIL